MKITDYKFNVRCLEFLEKIEKDYGSSILIEEINLGSATHGHVYYSECMPRIEINQCVDFKEDVIIHEAYHLRLKLDGMPTPSYSHLNRKINGIEKDRLLFFHQRFWDKIEHHYFFPKIKNELGLDPYLIGKKLLVESFDKVIERGRINADEIGVTSSIVQAWIETNDEDFLDEVANYFRVEYGNDIVENGIYLIEVLKDTSLITFEDCFYVYEKFFEYMLPEYRVSKRLKAQAKKCDRFSLYYMRYLLEDVKM